MAVNELDAVNYKNGQKNHWRRTMWNFICKANPDKSLPVVYLPGSEDLDAKEATRRGWDDRNLIAIERSGAVVKHLRSCARNVIRGDVASVVTNWPDDQPVGVVIADLQGGIGKDAFLVISAWLLNNAMRRSVLMINLQRGREAGPLWEPYKFMSGQMDNDYFREKMGISNKHRGLLAVVGAMHVTLTHLATLVGNENELTPRERLIRYTELSGLEWAFPPTYRSKPGSPLFDSIVLFRKPDFSGLSSCDRWQGMKDSTVRSRISAALAVRTMRLNGQLPRAS